MSTLADIKVKRKRVLKRPKLWCCLCGMQFDLEEDLVEHISYHESGSLLQCCKCTYMTRIPEQMNHHLREQHGEIYGSEMKRIYRCVLCKFKAKWKRRMEIHVDCHFEKKNEQTYQCQICSKLYLSHASLRKHKKTHAGVRPHVCGICGSSFVFRSYLNSHLRTHNTEKAFQCTFCSLQFVTRSGLKRHERIHTGEKPYKCLLCNHRSARSDGIDRHYINVHSNYKPFKCDHCDITFATRNKLERHMTVHSADKEFYCKECEKEFKSIDTLKYHCKYYSHQPDIRDLNS